uniref:NADH-ubiquinone oxidoreductase chain 4L n=1 Tax=Pristomyrmex punctatus TaxID=507543 RepID=E5RQ03_9HYME|nr:NADH dehydrogenase subunit 4L [Pristomyrmex punctatus]BAJ53356.1 NADH dehydrogenase subunit 4L [Pristomyrmex punctatus]BAJ53369.1 NADH dehydrogenase subunit 4L [Pristomyrmex punctatus]
MMIYFYIFWVIMMVLVYLYKYMLILLILMELMVLNISLVIFLTMSILKLEFFMIYYLVFSVCESVLGLGLLVMIVRYHGSDLYYTMNISKY